MLHAIRINNLKYLGRGASGIVVTDGKFAYKFGEIYAPHVDTMRKLAPWGITIPVRAFYPRIRVPRSLLQRVAYIHKQSADFSYGFWSFDSYIDGTICDVLVTPLATPIADIFNDTWEDTEKVYTIMIKLKAKYLALTGNTWNDDHMGNVAMYQRRAVIIDL